MANFISKLKRKSLANTERRKCPYVNQQETGLLFKTFLSVKLGTRTSSNTENIKQVTKTSLIKTISFEFVIV